MSAQKSPIKSPGKSKSKRIFRSISERNVESNSSLNSIAESPLFMDEDNAPAGSSPGTQ